MSGTNKGIHMKSNTKQLLSKSVEVVAPQKKLLKRKFTEEKQSIPDRPIKQIKSINTNPVIISSDTPKKKKKKVISSNDDANNDNECIGEVIIDEAPVKLQPKTDKSQSKAVVPSSLSSISSVSASATGKLSGWDWYHSIGSPRWILSPMVGQSELAYRLLCRNHGTQLAYTPMIIASKFVESGPYRDAIFQTCTEDRPLIVQFCANDPSMFVNAARLVEDRCDAVDLNLGCPQEVARKGGYGSWMMEKQELIRTIVRKAVAELKVPVTVKVRVFETFRETLAYCKMLEDAGASMIVIHGRMRHHREEFLADWSTAHRIRPFLRIPVVLNGDLWDAEDIAMCMGQVEVDGFMSAQGILHNPALFEPLATTVTPPHPVQNNDIEKYAGDKSSLKSHPITLARARASSGASSFSFLAPVPDSRFRLRRSISPFISFSLTSVYRHPLSGLGATAAPTPRAANPKLQAFVDKFKKSISTPEDAVRQFKLCREYLEIVAKHPVAHASMVRRHMFFMLFDSVQANLDMYDDLYVASQMSQYLRVLDVLEERAKAGKACKNPGDVCKATDKPRSRRRDGTIAPPPWPVGGGGMNVNQTKALNSHADDDEEMEVVNAKGRVVKIQDKKNKHEKNNKSNNKKQAPNNNQDNNPQKSKIDTSKMDLSRFD